MNRVICEECNGDITTTDNVDGYRLVLKAERLPPRTSTVTLMGVRPPLPSMREYHFCGKKHLLEWLARFMDYTIRQNTGK